jgi:hypothetical protein
VCVLAVDSSYTSLLEAECCWLVFWIYFLLLLLLLNKSLRLGVARTFYTTSYYHTTITFLFYVTISNKVITFITFCFYYLLLLLLSAFITYYFYYFLLLLLITFITFCFYYFITFTTFLNYYLLLVISRPSQVQVSVKTDELFEKFSSLRRTVRQVQFV